MLIIALMQEIHCVHFIVVYLMYLNDIACSSMVITMHKVCCLLCARFLVQGYLR